MGIEVRVRTKKDSRGKKISWQETQAAVNGTVYQNYPNYHGMAMKWYRDEVDWKFKPYNEIDSDDPSDVHRGGCIITFRVKKTLRKNYSRILEEYLGPSFRDILEGMSDLELLQMLQQLSSMKLSLDLIREIHNFSNDENDLLNKFNNLKQEQYEGMKRGVIRDLVQPIRDQIARELWDLQRITEFGMFCQMVGHFGHTLKWDV